MTGAISNIDRDLDWARRAVRRPVLSRADLAAAIDTLDRNGDGLDVETARHLRHAMALPPLHSQDSINRALRRDRFWRRIDRMLVAGIVATIALTMVLLGLHLPAAAARAALIAGGM